MNWKRTLARKGIKAHTFFSVDDFLRESPSYSFETPIYIDSNLGEGLKGEFLSESIADKGFIDLHIQTGCDSSIFTKPEWIKSIKGKSPLHL